MNELNSNTTYAITSTANGKRAEIAGPFYHEQLAQRVASVLKPTETGLMLTRNIWVDGGAPDEDLDYGDQLDEERRLLALPVERLRLEL